MRDTELLNHLKQLRKKATGGEWQQGDIDENPIKGVISLEDDGGCNDPDCCGGPSYRIDTKESDLEYIVELHNSFDRLIELAESAISAKSETASSESQEDSDKGLRMKRVEGDFFFDPYIEDAEYAFHHGSYEHKGHVTCLPIYVPDEQAGDE